MRKYEKVTPIVVGVLAGSVILIVFIFTPEDEKNFSEVITNITTTLIAIFTGFLMSYTYSLAKQQRVSNDLKKTSNDIELAKINLEKQLRTEKKEETRKHNLGMQIGLIEERYANVMRRMREFGQKQSLNYEQWLQDNQNDDGTIPKSKFQKMLKKTDEDNWKLFKEINKEEEAYMRAEYSKRTGRQWRDNLNERDVNVSNAK